MEPADPAPKGLTWPPAAIGLAIAACLAAVAWTFFLGPMWEEYGWRTPLVAVVLIGFAALLLNAIKIIAHLGFVAGPAVILIALAALGFAGSTVLD